MTKKEIILETIYLTCVTIFLVCIHDLPNIKFMLAGLAVLIMVHIQGTITNDR